jgi:hypothetical protein
MRFPALTEDDAVAARAVMRVERAVHCCVRAEISDLSAAISLSSVVIGSGTTDDGDLNLTICQAYQSSRFAAKRWTGPQTLSLYDSACSSLSRYLKSICTSSSDILAPRSNASSCPNSSRLTMRSVKLWPCFSRAARTCAANFSRAWTSTKADVLSFLAPDEPS